MQYFIFFILLLSSSVVMNGDDLKIPVSGDVVSIKISSTGVPYYTVKRTSADSEKLEEYYVIHRETVVGPLDAIRFYYLSLDEERLIVAGDKNCDFYIYEGKKVYGPYDKYISAKSTFSKSKPYSLYQVIFENEGLTYVKYPDAEPILQSKVLFNSYTDDEKPAFAVKTSSGSFIQSGSDILFGPTNEIIVNFRFDKSRIDYIYEKGLHKHLVLSSREFGPYDDVDFVNGIFPSDYYESDYLKQNLYKYKVGNQWFLMLNGLRYGPYSSIEFVLFRKGRLPVVVDRLNSSEIRLRNTTVENRPFSYGVNFRYNLNGDLVLSAYDKYNSQYIYQNDELFGPFSQVSLITGEEYSYTKNGKTYNVKNGVATLTEQYNGNINLFSDPENDFWIQKVDSQFFFKHKNRISDPFSYVSFNDLVNVNNNPFGGYYSFTRENQLIFSGYRENGWYIYIDFVKAIGPIKKLDTVYYNLEQDYLVYRDSEDALYSYLYKNKIYVGQSWKNYIAYVEDGYIKTIDTKQ